MFSGAWHIPWRQLRLPCREKTDPWMLQKCNAWRLLPQRPSSCNGTSRTLLEKQLCEVTRHGWGRPVVTDLGNNRASYWLHRDGALTPCAGCSQPCWRCKAAALQWGKAVLTIGHELCSSFTSVPGCNSTNLVMSIPVERLHTPDKVTRRRTWPHN